MSKEKKAYLDIKTETQGQYRILNARVVGDDGYGLYWDERRGVAFTSQTDAEYLMGGGDIKMYGHVLVWNASQHTIKELKDGVKCIQSLINKLFKVDDQYGPPASFGAWVQRVATALKVDGVRVNGDPTTAARVAWKVDEIIENWRKELCPVEE